MLHISAAQAASTQSHAAMDTVQHLCSWWGMLISAWNNKMYTYASEGRYCGFSFPHTTWQEFSNFLDIHFNILQGTFTNTKKRVDDAYVFFQEKFLMVENKKIQVAPKHSVLQ